VLQAAPSFAAATGLRAGDALGATALSFLCSGASGAGGAAAADAAAALTDALRAQLSATVFLDAPGARGRAWRVTATPLLGQLSPRGGARRALALLIPLPISAAEAEAAMALCRGCGTVQHSFRERDLAYLLRGFQAHTAGFPGHGECAGGEGFTSAAQCLNQRLSGLLWPTSPPGRPTGGQ
jgi:hypothetical protein